MRAWRLHKHGGPDAQRFEDGVPVPDPASGEVLIKVAAAGLNNTDINTRVGWYSKSVQRDTADAARQDTDAAPDDGAWTGQPLDFPRIQGADCCGHIVAVGDGVDASRVGERILVRALQRAGPRGSDPDVTYTFGSECDGAFAEYALARSFDALRVNAAWSDTELASLPCAYSTAEAMLQRANVGAEKVLITGASGGVGSAAVQLAQRRGARVSAVTGANKEEALRAVGADATLSRDSPYGTNAFDVLVDLVAGPRFQDLITALAPGGRYVTSGAIAGPIVSLDVRDLYLKDLTMLGSTLQSDTIFTDLIAIVEAGEISPLVSAVYPFEALQKAQEAFLEKSHVGKIVLDVAGSPS
ncbi:MAG: alcohol dehydrogenase family protein [Pseudomonadota bacterium]